MTFISSEGLRAPRILSLRDAIAIIVAVTLGAASAYLSSLAGYAWPIPAGSYAFLVIPAVVMVVADQRKLFVWQVCIFSFILFVRAKFPGMRNVDTLKMVFVFWALGTIFSLPAPAYLYLRRLKGRIRYIAAGMIVVLAVVLWLLVKRITG